MEPLVSMVIPVYNVEKYLEKCLISIINQTYKNIEIILVDDGSSDCSGVICEKFAKKDGRIHIIKKKNGGLSDARNVGINNSRGDYICFVDSDDYVDKNYVLKMYSSLLTNNADICICNFFPVTEEGNKSKKQYGSKLSNSVFLNSSINSILLSDLNVSMTVAWNKMYKKSLFEGIRYPTGKLHEDEWTTYKLLYKSARICTIDDELYYYVQRTNSITNSKRKISNAFDVFEGFFERYCYARQNKNILLARDSINRCISELRTIIQSYEYNLVCKRVKTEFLRVLFKCPFYIRQYFYKLKLLRKIIIEYIEYCETRRTINKINELSNSSKQNIIMLGTPVHGNLGDQAIVVAEKKFFSKLGFSKNTIFEFQTDTLNQYYESILKSLTRFSVVIIDGGGNLGSYWPNEHERIMRILSLVDNCPIIMFPETIYYSKDDFEQNFLLSDLPIFSKASNCLYMLRDKQSYDFFENHLKLTKHIYVPDIVFSLKSESRKKKKNTKKIAFIFRSDKEKAVGDNEIAVLKDFLRQKGYSIESLNTISRRKRISKVSREKEIIHLFKKISKAELVVTDRLHGMIFSYVNNTKCFSLNNLNKKVEGSYFWISSDNNYMVRDKIDNLEILELAEADNKYSGATVDFSRMQVAVKEWIKIKE